MDQKASANPLFSIGVTTYNRKDLLKEMLLSLVNQDFSDFEIIIGNDCTNELLTQETIGVKDDRIVIVNNRANLGELENMNSLLAKAKGKYFTWQFDDDLCAPTFLSETFRILEKLDFPICVFTSFTNIYGEVIFEFPKKETEDMRLYSGRDFLRLFLSGRIGILGSGGFYKTDYLRSIGGAPRLSDGKMAIYSEYLLIFKSGLLDHVAYLNSKLIAFRVHNSSWSGTTAEVELYKQAGINLIRESLLIFSTSRLKEDFNKNLVSLLKSVISMVITKSRMAGIKIKMEDLNEYISLIQCEFASLKEPELYELSVKCLKASMKNIPLFHLKAWLKTLISIRYLKYAHIAISYISKYTNKSF